MKSIETAVLIPIKKFEKSKTRLKNLLTSDERFRLCNYLVEDLFDKVMNLKNIQIVVITSQDIKSLCKIRDNIKIIEEPHTNGLNHALNLANDYIQRRNFACSIVIPIDIPLLNTYEIEKIINYSRNFVQGVCMVPSHKFDGTNILLRKPHTIIETSFDNNSFQNHKISSVRKKIELKIFDHDSLRYDVDTIEDITYIIEKYKVFIKDYNNKTGQLGSRSIEYLIDIISQKKDTLFDSATALNNSQIKGLF